MEMKETKTYLEIISQPENLAQVANLPNSVIDGFSEFIRAKKIHQIHYVGCGSSYALAKALSTHTRRLSRGETLSRFFTGSELMFGFEQVEPRSLVIGISRSGDSTETLEALRVAKKESKAFIGGITCEENSPICKLTDVCITLPFVKQQSFVMTAGFTAMAFAQTLLLRILYGYETKEYRTRIVQVATKFCEESLKAIESWDFRNLNHFTFLGYEESNGVASEGVIKLSEMAVANADSFQTLEYRHGPRSKITPNSLLTLFSTQKSLPKEMQMVVETAEMGAQILHVGSTKIPGLKNLILEDIEAEGNWFLKLFPIHWIGLFKSIASTLNPDLPRFLSRVVKIDL